MNRPLTTVERSFLEMGRFIVMNPVVLVRCAGHVDHAVLTEVVHRVQARHPVLNVRLVPGERPWFGAHGTPPAEVRCVPRADADTWRAEVHRALNEPFDPRRDAQLRVILVQGDDRCEILCVTDHLTADGRSGLFVLRDILRLLANPDLVLPTLPARASFDARLPRAWWLPRTSASFLSLLAEQHRARLAARGWTPPHRFPEERPAVAVLEHRLPPDLTARLLARCRAEGCTLQAALMAAATIALAGEVCPGRTGTLGCITPIDVRRRLSPPVGDDFGIYAWAPTSVYRASDRSPLWAQAQAARTALRRYQHPDALAAMRVVVGGMAALERTPWADLYSRLLGRGLEGVSVVSNLGRVALPTEAGPLRVEDAAFYAIIPGVDFVLATLGFGGSVSLCFCHEAPAADRTARIAARAVALLTEAATPC